MAFNMSYRGLNDRNIKYIYSDQKITFTHPQKVSFRPLKEERPLPPLKKYPKRFYEYYHRYNIGIPRAPAFRATDPENVDKIVQRISKPIECQKDRRQDIQDENEAGDVDNNGAETDRSDASKKKTPRDISEMIARLQKPTESSKRKEYVRRSHTSKEDSMFVFKPLPPIRC